ncbi:hypothetical protein D9M72_269430 [compost metagenome]
MGEAVACQPLADEVDAACIDFAAQGPSVLEARREQRRAEAGERVEHRVARLREPAHEGQHLLDPSAIAPAHRVPRAQVVRQPVARRFMVEHQPAVTAHGQAFAVRVSSSTSCPGSQPAHSCPSAK